MFTKCFLLRLYDEQGFDYSFDIYTFSSMTDVAETLEELDGCELGTKEFWENSYSNEISNYKSHGKISHVLSPAE